MRACPRCGARYAGGEVCPQDGAPLLDSTRDALIGTTLGEYQPLERVSSGAMSQVYRARHAKRGGQYALKLLAASVGDDDVYRERFARELRAIQELAHPNVVALVDSGTTPTGRRYLVMEWVEGRELSEAIRGEGPFPPLRAAHVARQIASGLVAIHDAGFVHRDLKPHNVMLSGGGQTHGGAPKERVKIVDFGLVHADANLWNRLTRAGDIVGTPFYMAPEVIEGREADARTDLYALGVILYEMLAGQVPFASPAIPEILAKHLLERPAELAECGGLELIAHDLLAKAPGRRPGSAREVLERLDGLDLTLAQTAPSRAPSLLTMVTAPGLARAELDAPAAVLDLTTDLGLARSIAVGDTAQDARLPSTLDPAAFDGASSGPEQLATAIAPRTAPREPTHGEGLATRAGSTSGEPPLEDDDPTAALPADAATYVGTGDELPHPRAAGPSDAPHRPHDALPAPAVTVGPALEGFGAVIRVHPPRDVPREHLAREAPREGARDYARDLAREGARAPAGAREAPLVREVPRDGARDPAKDAAREVKVVEQERGPWRPAGVAPLAALGVLLLLLAAGAATALYVVRRAEDRGPRVVEIPVASDQRPRAIARQPATEPSSASTPREPLGTAPSLALPHDAVAAAPAPDGPATLGDVAPELRRLAAARGFEPDELADVPEVAPRYLELQRATASGDLAGARLALQDLAAALSARAPDLELLRRRGEAIASQLVSARARIAPQRMRALEARYLELSARISARPAPREIPGVLRALRELRAELAQGVEAAGAR